MTNALSKIKQEKISFHRTPPKKETKKDLNPEIKSLLQDTFLMSQSREFAKELIEGQRGGALDINSVFNAVRQYQSDYILLKKKGVPKEMLEIFTPRVWWEARGCK